MSCKLKKLVVFVKIFTCLLLSRPFIIVYSLNVEVAVTQKIQTDVQIVC